MSRAEMEANAHRETEQSGPRNGRSGSGNDDAAAPGLAHPAGRRRWVVAAGAVMLVAAAGAAAVVGSSSKKPGHTALSLPRVIAKATPSIVRIEGMQAGVSVGGSGVVIDARRQLVLTNAHVVDGVTALKAQVGNDTAISTPVQIVAASPCDDLAVVRLVDSEPGLRAIPFGSATTLRPGDQVISMGFPGSLQSSGLGVQTSTGQSSTVESHTGTVSQSDVQSSADPGLPAYQDLIAHQAFINHGDSGGALLNSEGSLVGINTLGNQANQGQYYAISIDYVKRILPELETGRSEADLGWQLVPVSGGDSSLPQNLAQFYASEGASQSLATTIGNAVASYLQANNINGMMIVGETPGSVIDKSPLAVGDMITQIDGNPVQTFSDVCQNLQGATPGQTVHVADINIGDLSNQKQFVTVLGGNGGDPSLDTDLTVPTS